MNVTSILRKIIPWALNIFISVDLPLIKSLLKLLFSYDVKLRSHISFDILYVHKSNIWNEISV